MSDVDPLTGMSTYPDPVFNAIDHEGRSIGTFSTQQQALDAQSRHAEEQTRSLSGSGLGGADLPLDRSAGLAKSRPNFLARPIIKIGGLPAVLTWSIVICVPCAIYILTRTSLPLVARQIAAGITISFSSPIFWTAVKKIMIVALIIFLALVAIAIISALGPHYHWWH